MRGLWLRHVAELQSLSIASSKTIFVAYNLLIPLQYNL